MFKIDRAGIYDINGGVIYQPELTSIVNIVVILSASSHNKTIHTYRTPPNVIIIHAHDDDVFGSDVGVKVNVNEDKIATLMALLAGLRHSNKEGALGTINGHSLFTKDAFRGVVSLATQTNKNRTTPDYGDFNGRVAHDLEKYNYGAKLQEDDVREPEVSAPSSYGRSYRAPPHTPTDEDFFPSHDDYTRPPPGAGRVAPAFRAEPFRYSYHSNSNVLP
jgi:hypothetical protein